MRRAYAFRHNNRAYVIRCTCAANVINGEFHRINAFFVLIVAKLQLRLVHYLAVLIKGRKVGFCRRCFGDIDKPRALLSNRIRQAVGIQYNVRCRHHQLIDNRRNLYCGKLAENIGVALYVLADQRRCTRLVGRCHRSTRQSFITLPRYSRQNFTAVRRNFRLNLQIRSRSPRREVGHKRTCNLFFANLNDTRTLLCEHFAVVLRNGANRTVVVADLHTDRTGYVVINNDTCRAFGFQRNAYLFFKRRYAALYKHDFIFIEFLAFGIIGNTPHTGNCYVFKITAGNVSPIRS